MSILTNVKLTFVSSPINFDHARCFVFFAINLLWVVPAMKTNKQAISQSNLVPSSCPPSCGRRYTSAICIRWRLTNHLREWMWNVTNSTSIFHTIFACFTLNSSSQVFKCSDLHCQCMFLSTKMHFALIADLIWGQSHGDRTLRGIINVGSGVCCHIENAEDR